MQTDTVGTVLEDLIQTLEDGHQGFDKVAEHLEGQANGSVAERMRSFAEQRADFADELRSLAAMHGIELNDSGTIAGAVHRGWIGLKDAVTGDDASAVLGAAETGEDHAVSEYEEALEMDLPAEVRTVIQRQAAGVKQAHDEVRNLRDTL
jgi:uncharacterized protein (TIGR02284 family)